MFENVFEKEKKKRLFLEINNEKFSVQNTNFFCKSLLSAVCDFFFICVKCFQQKFLFHIFKKFCTMFRHIVQFIIAFIRFISLRFGVIFLYEKKTFFSCFNSNS